MANRPPDDPSAIAGRLYDAYGASLYRYALLLLANGPAAEDAVQQVFASLLRRSAVVIEQDAHYLRRESGTNATQRCVERYRRDHGQRIPSTLAGLVPAYLNEVPTDPCSDGPLLYRVTAGGVYGLWRRAQWLRRWRESNARQTAVARPASDLGLRFGPGNFCPDDSPALTTLGVNGSVTQTGAGTDDRGVS